MLGKGFVLNGKRERPPTDAALFSWLDDGLTAVITPKYVYRRAIVGFR